MKTWLLTCWFVFAWVAAIFAQNEGLNFYAEGEDYRKRGLFPQALAKYEEALRREPNNYRYLFAKAQTLEKFKNKVDDALSVLNTAVRLRSDYAPIYELMARIYKDKKGDPERAAQLYNIAYKNERNKELRLKYKFEVIDYYIKKKEYELAQRHIREAKVFAINNLRVHYADAYVANQLENYTAAQATILVIESKLQALSNEAAAPFYFELGYAYFKQKKYKKAYQTWKKAYQGEYKQRILRYQPTYLLRLARVYADIYELDVANLYIRQILAINPQVDDAYILQAEILDREILKPQQLSLYEKALSMTQSNGKRAMLYLRIAQIHANYKNFEESLEAARQGLELAKTPDLYTCEVIALFQLERQKEARISLETLIKNTSRGVKTSLFLYMLGVSYKDEGNFRRALELFAQVNNEPYKTAAQEEAFLIRNGKDTY